MQNNHGKWAISHDEECWNEGEFLDTREDAIAFGMERAKEEGWTVFYAGKVKNVEIRAGNLGDQLLENISIDHCDDHGELAENFLCRVDKEHLDILDEKLEEVVTTWAEEYGYQPDYFLIEGAEEIDVDEVEELKIQKDDNQHDIQIYDLICPSCGKTDFKYTEESPINPVCQGCGHILTDDHIQKVLKAVYQDHMQGMQKGGGL